MNAKQHNILINKLLLQSFFLCLAIPLFAQEYFRADFTYDIKEQSSGYTIPQIQNELCEHNNWVDGHNMGYYFFDRQLNQFKFYPLPKHHFDTHTKPDKLPYPIKVKETYVAAAGNEESVHLSILPFWEIDMGRPILFAILLLGLFYAFFQYHMYYQMQLKRLRSQISSDLHDEVGSLLSGVAMQSELMEMSASLNDKIRLKRVGLKDSAIIL